MAVIKCKMCGGDLQIAEGASVCECEYCGTKQTVPTADNEKKLTLFSRAGRLLRNCEFDKAFGVFESIVADFPEEAEAYWGLCLCRYGIEYVDDPATAKKIPTCHRTVSSSIMDDSDFDMACENADAIARRLYREEAKAIDRIQQGILSIVSKEEPYDVFICYKELDENGERTEDSVLGQEIYDSLTNKGLKVFFSRITLESKLGEEYEPYIYAALLSAKVMLAIGTSYEYYDAVWVKNEWARFLIMMKTDPAKKLIPCFKGIDAYDMPREFKNFLAQDLGKLGWQQDLTRGVMKICEKEEKNRIVVSSDSSISALNVQTEAMLKRGFMMLEDGDYQKADELFEKVLNNNAECGQAYWGKALVTAKVSNAEQYGAYLLKCLKQKAKVKNLSFSARLPSTLAREADETGILKSFTDQQLDLLLEDVSSEPVHVQSSADYYEAQGKLMQEPSYLHKLAVNRDFDRAAQYADEVVRQAEMISLNSLKELTIKAASGEREKENAGRQVAERQEKMAITTIKRRLSVVKKEYEEYEQHREEIEKSQREAEQRAEEEYKTAVADFEKAYQNAIDRHEADYLKELELWQLRMTEFESAYDIAVTKEQKLIERIRQLTTERDRLRGMFGRIRRKELENNIQILYNELEAIVIPENPGDRPTKPSAPQKGKPPQREDFKADVMTDGASDLREQVKCSLSPAYKECKPFIDRLKNKKSGDELSFGSYPVKNGEKAPVKWIILSREDNRLLVISKYGIDCQQYHRENKAITWENCSLRTWLNDIFINSAFSAKEQCMIPIVSVTADKNPYYNTDPGNPTQDKIFLLSFSEANQYFHSNLERKCKPTEYAIEQGCFTKSGYCSWGLRTPGVDSEYVLEVSEKGAINLDGGNVNVDDYEIGIGYGVIAVRPAFWIEYID